MKFIFLIFIFIPFSIYSGYITAEIRAESDFFEHSIKDFSLNNKLEFELEASVPLILGLNLWGNCICLKQEKTCEIEHPKIISSGLKFSLQMTPFLTPYVGIGASVRDIEKIDREHIENKIRAHDFNYVGKSGILYFITSSLFIDFFADYYHSSQQNSNFNDIVRTGVGLGIGF